ncbi:hypothetical protein C8J56DRAFT_1013447 [Mycena floridula]|nr:hypothetical protein C8J56DRAFT_1013447 [Mycena floridula]
MSLTPRAIGTLVVVVIQANHLPNKRHIGKQDPYCVLSVNGKKGRTRVIKGGGQHPEWDHELRFEIKEAVDAASTRTDDGTPPPLPPKNPKSIKDMEIEGGKMMKLACYADHVRDPDLIGETEVDLTEVLAKGECDEWYTLMAKDKFAGKVKLEMTFWSNELPPVKKTKKLAHDGGPGSFIASDTPSPSPTNRQSQTTRVASTSVMHDHAHRQSESIMRASRSTAQIDLYNPPYEQRNRLSAVDSLTNDFQEFGVVDLRQAESLPVSLSFVSIDNHGPNGHRDSLPLQAPSQPQYEPVPAAPYNPPPFRRPRYSLPPTPSGFVPLAATSNFAEPSGLAASVSHTPAPYVYGNSHFAPQGFQGLYPPPNSFAPQPFPPQPFAYQPQQQYPAQNGYAYEPYGPEGQPYQPEIQHSYQPEGQHLYQPEVGHPYQPEGQQHPYQPEPPYHPEGLTSSTSGSRPLPQPQTYQLNQVPYNPGPAPEPSPVPPPPPPPPLHYSPLEGHNGSQLPLPPPPPLHYSPLEGHNGSQLPLPPPPPLQYSPLEGHNGSQLPLPLPPPLPQFNSSPRRRSSLPQPPLNPVPQSSGFRPPPPPGQHYYPGPPHAAPRATSYSQPIWA